MAQSYHGNGSAHYSLNLRLRPALPLFLWRTVLVDYLNVAFGTGRGVPVFCAPINSPGVTMTGAANSKITINRAPVLTLWATVVAERLGFDHAEALTLGKAVAGLNAYAKGVRLGIYEPAPATVKKQRKELEHGARLTVSLLNRAVPATRTPDGLRALAKEKPVDAASVERYLSAKFGPSLEATRRVMADLAGALPPHELAAQAYALYEKFRPEIPAGVTGWGAKGTLDLAVIEQMARKR
jgi:hypothetical protein